MDHLIAEVFMVVSISLGIPSIVAGYLLGRRFLKIVERREDAMERRLVLEERERELEIYKLELEIRQLSSGEKFQDKQ